MRSFILILCLLVGTHATAEERSASYVADDGSLYIMTHGKCIYKHHAMPGFREAFKVGQAINKTHCWRYTTRGGFFITNFAGNQFHGEVEDLVYEDIEGMEEDDEIVAPSKSDYTTNDLTESESVNIPAGNPIAPDDDLSDVRQKIQSKRGKMPADQEAQFNERVRKGEDAATEWVDEQGRIHYRVVLH